MDDDDDIYRRVVWSRRKPTPIMLTPHLRRSPQVNEPQPRRLNVTQALSRKGRANLLALLCLGAMGTATGHVPPRGAHITIEAGDVEYTIDEIVRLASERYERDLFYDANALRGFRTRAVRNAPDWKAALRQMLVGTGFEVQVTRLGVMDIRRKPEPPPEVTAAHAAERNRYRRPRARTSMPSPARECVCQFASSFGLRIALTDVCDEDGQLQFDARCDGTVGTILR
jgi:hypothetical protein